jgi:hypothetical protein
MKICNQCAKEMTMVRAFFAIEAIDTSQGIIKNYSEARIYTCNNAECPNYALLQIPMEDMRDILTSEKYKI